VLHWKEILDTLPVDGNPFLLLTAADGTRLIKPKENFVLKKYYRVLLTRARQGMVIGVPNGDAEDDTKKAEYYDVTFGYLNKIGIKTI